MIMPRNRLSPEEDTLVESIVKRKVRLLVLAEEHAAVVRSKGKEVLEQAYNEASRALAPKTGQETMYPPGGTNVEEYYQMFEPALTANAQTPYEHMYIALVAAGLIAVVTGCEYAYLSEQAQYETDKRMREATRECFSPPNRQASTGLTQVRVQQLPILPPVDPDAVLIELEGTQVNEFLGNFSKLHHKILYDTDSRECYKVIAVNHSLTSPTIKSFEVQLQECPSVITISFDDVKQMLLRSSMVVE